MPSTANHCMVNLFLLSKFCKANLRSSSTFYTIFFGSMFPDTSMWLFGVYAVFAGYGLDDAFDHYTGGWIRLKDYFHSIPISLAATIVYFVIYRYFYCNQFIPETIFCIKQTNNSQSGLLDNNTDIEIGSIGNNHNTNANKSENILIDALIDMDTDNDMLNATCKNCWFNMRYFTRLNIYFFLSMLLHGIFDFFLHTDFAHSHFMPFDDWKFRSPVSAFDVNHYGYIWITFELIVCVCFIPWILKIKKDQWKQSR
eukprot:551548_1